MLRRFKHSHRVSIVSFLFITIATLLAPATSQAYSLLPLTAEIASTLPSGTAEATIGLSYFQDMRFPAFTPSGALRRQTLIEAPQVGFRIGAGDWAEIQASFEMVYLDEETAGGVTNRHFGAGDARLATKVHIVRERELIPGFGLHFGTKLPDANRSNRLGTDDTDFWFVGVASKDLGVLDVHANLGILLLGNSGSTIGTKFHAGGQDDLFTYVFAAASKPLGPDTASGVQLRLLGEITGWSGSRYDNDRSAGRVGLQFKEGAGTFFIGTSFGFVTGSENVGGSVGYVYQFDPASLFSGD